MTKYNFDQIIDRKGTNAIKVDALKEVFGKDNLTPLWVADMDFLSPPEITEAIVKRAEHGVYGYTAPGQEYYDSIIGWLKNVHDWKIEQEWLSFIPGIVKGIAFATDCFSEINDSIVIQPPVYHPFKIIPTLHKRQIINNELILESGKYRMNLDALISQIDSSCKILILCNPHNPGGRVWTKKELIDLAEICYDNNILVISDEIHSDLAYPDNKHIPFASVSEKAAQNSITFMAPSKTFNIAGIVSSYSVIPNEKLRKIFYHYLERSELNQGHIFAYTATCAAYNKGNEWLKEAKKYLWNNIVYVDNYLKKNIPEIKAMIPEASFLIWLDCKQLNLSQSDLVSLFINKAGLALNDGTMFGTGGEGYMRMNIGSPRSIIEEALNNLKKAVIER